MLQRQIALVGYACGIGSEHKGSRHGPEAIKAYLASQPESKAWPWQAIISHADAHRHLHSFAALDVITTLCEQLATETAAALARGSFPVVLGGDHSSAIGTWSGISTALRARGATGLLWFDAHMDSHTTGTTPSGYCHGMPIASLLGAGVRKFAEIADANSKILPENICLIGVREYEPEEKVFLESKGVRVFYMTEVAARGLSSVVDEALAHIKRNVTQFGISIDIDGFDPTSAPAVGTAVPGGIDGSEFLDSYKELCTDDMLVGVEVAEFNPAMDVELRTHRLLKDIIGQLLQG